MAFGGTIKAIFIKDLVSELRSRQLLPVMIMLGVLMVWVFRIATEGTAADNSVIGGAVLLLAILFSAILASERSFGVEEGNECISGLILAPVDAGDIYIGKLLVNFVMMSIFEVVVVIVVSVVLSAFSELLFVASLEHEQLHLHVHLQSFPSESDNSPRKTTSIGFSDNVIFHPPNHSDRVDICQRNLSSNIL